MWLFKTDGNLGLLENEYFCFDYEKLTVSWNLIVPPKLIESYNYAIIIKIKYKNSFFISFLINLSILGDFRRIYLIS